MKLSLITGLLAPALLSVAAASQTIVVVRPLPFTGVPRILPAPIAGLPLTPARLPSPMPMLPAQLALQPAALPLLPAPMALAARSALPAVRMDASKEMPAALRALVRIQLEPAVREAEKAEPKPVAIPWAEVFDGRRVTLPEDDLEHELGLR